MDVQSFAVEAGGCAADELFALQVLGDSMEPEFENGCIIVIDPAGVIQNGCFVMAEVNGEHIFRQLLVQEERIYLKPMKSSYETIEIPDLKPIAGVIVQKAGTRRKDRKHYV
ncbi:MAG: S24 family peptidase [Thiohalobacteraceae bacterium]